MSQIALPSLLPSTGRGWPCYVAVLNISDFVGVIVELADPTMSDTWPTKLDSEPFYCSQTQYVPTLKLCLRRPCQPVLGQNSSSPFPVPSRVTAAGQDLMVDYMILACEMPALVQEIVATRQIPQGETLHPGEVYGVIPGRITPHLVGDCGGWDMRFRIEINCVGADCE